MSNLGPKIPGCGGFRFAMVPILCFFMTSLILGIGSLKNLDKEFSTDPNGLFEVISEISVLFYVCCDEESMWPQQICSVSLRSHDLSKHMNIVPDACNHNFHNYERIPFSMPLPQYSIFV